MILVADGGSTKTSWVLIKPDKNIQFFDTEGYNPYFVDSGYIIASLTANIPISLEKKKITQVYFYGAGCFPDKAHILETALAAVFQNSSVSIDLDLVGAAKALLGDSDGFAAILGTGSNTCLFSHGRIVHYIDSLGYFLGDEGSGCDIGKRLLRDYARGYLPENLRDRFFSAYGLQQDEIISMVYSQSLINTYCASFCTFVSANIDNDHIANIVTGSFTDFFRNLVSKYPGYSAYSFNCVGSVGFVFQDILKSTTEKFGMKCGKILQSPIDGLASYYKEL